MIQIQWTCGDLVEAREVCRALLEQRLIACANILPDVESHYVWQGQLEQAREVKVYLKTQAEQFDSVKQVIEQRCTYDVPEILAFPVVASSHAYAQWVKSLTDSR